MKRAILSADHLSTQNNWICFDERLLLLPNPLNTSVDEPNFYSLSGYDKNGVHLPQISGFNQWMWISRSSTLLVLWTSKFSEKNLNKKVLLTCFSET